MASFLIRDLDDATHTAAKTLAAHQKISLDKFIKDAILARCMQIAHREGLTDTVIKNIERENKKNGNKKSARS